MVRSSLSRSGIASGFYQAYSEFMARNVFILLLIAGLVACPYRCSGSLPRGVAESVQTEACGGCCAAKHVATSTEHVASSTEHVATSTSGSHEQVRPAAAHLVAALSSSRPTHLPQLPATCECPNCLCEGVVLGGLQEELPANDVVAPLHMQSEHLLKLCGSDRATRRERISDGSATFPNKPNGRILRIAHQSLLN